MSLHGERCERHVAGLRLGRLGCDACRLNVIDDVMQELTQDGKGGAWRVWVDLDVGVLCRDGVDAGFGIEGEDGLLECFWGWSAHGLKAQMLQVNSRRTVNSFPRFSLMLPYLTRRSVVGVNLGTESGITRADLNLLSTSADIEAVTPEVGQDCISTNRGVP